MFDGIRHPDNPEINYYYPTNDLVTAPEIIFFWVARMIIFGYEYREQPPFRNVYFTGIVRDSQRRKMLKSLGNSPDPLELIKQYGADGIRTGMLFSSPAGNDLLFDIKLCEQGRNFSNKIWNALRLVKNWEVDDTLIEEGNTAAIAWFAARFNQTLIELKDHFAKFRMSDALTAVYKLMRDDFCSWYLEMVKPAYEAPIDRVTYNATLEFFEKMTRVLHPFVPFITEEVWHQLRNRADGDCVIVAPWPQPITTLSQQQADATLLGGGAMVIDVVTNLRNLRNSRQLSPKEGLPLFIKTDAAQVYRQFDSIIRKLANVTDVTYTDEPVEGAASFRVNAIQGRPDEFYVPLEDAIDPVAERERLEKERDYHLGFLKTVKKKLGNERFVQNAPEAVVALERKKQADAEAKIAAIEEQLRGLNG